MLFTQNKYYRWYMNIINNAKQRKLDSYVEQHHIIPRSLGGTNEKENIVELTAREHFICHVLLCRFTEGNARRSMYNAMRRMKGAASHQPRYINSKLYDILKKEYAAMGLSDEVRAKMRAGHAKVDPEKKRQLSSLGGKAAWSNPEVIKRREESRKNSAAWKQMLNNLHNKNVGRKNDSGTIDKMKSAATGRRMITNGSTKTWLKPGEEMPPGFKYAK